MIKTCVEKLNKIYISIYENYTVSNSGRILLNCVIHFGAVFVDMNVCISAVRSPTIYIEYGNIDVSLYPLFLACLNEYRYFYPLHGVIRSVYESS